MRRIQGIAFVLGSSFLACFVAADSPAQEGKVGDWVWSVEDSELFFASVLNSAGNVLGQYCEPEDGTCFYAVTFGASCDTGDKHTVLVNSDVGATPLEFLCTKKFKGDSVLVATDFDELDEIVRTADRIGFAIPLGGDEFKAVRFSLRGSNEAIDHIRVAAERHSESRTRKSKTVDVESF